MTTALTGKTVLITGASRGIGKAIGLMAASLGANVAIAAKSVSPHPTLPGTIFTAAEEMEKAGGKGLAIECDIRNDEQVTIAANKTKETFGSIDILVNNASAIYLQPTPKVPMKRYDLMNGVNARGTFAMTQACLPHLIESAKNGRNPHVLNISPPLNLDPKWFKNHTAYTISKYGMSMCTLGMSAEFKDYGIAVNTLWPRTGIATAAIEYIAGDEMLKRCRKVDIMADAAEIILTKESTLFTGNFCIDDETLEAEGITDLSKYDITPGAKLFPDFFVEER